jgi:hypothetical protein
MTVEDDEPDLSTTAPVDRPWQLKDRLSETDIQTIITEFRAGTPKHVLAARYSVSLSGLKSLLRRREVRRRPRPGSSP